jgi:8-oxo-dGTP pyrophosphatase MutT (NUDIX family)
LLREGAGGPEVYLLRRHRKASFMASSFVFPGGIADEGETDPRATAARELFEESGILLTAEETAAADRQARRDKLNIDKAEFAETMAGLTMELDRMHYFAHWITPSVEKRRYSAQFFIAIVPEGQLASPDNKETVDEIWVTPADALERSGELNLPPPQLRTFLELLEPAKGGIAGILEAARERAEHPHAILPRACASKAGLTLLMPWDAQYQSEGHGAALAMPEEHPLAWGPTRFVLGEGGWLHTSETE